MFRGLTFFGTNRNPFSQRSVLRLVFQTSVNMVAGGDVVERLEKRAVEAEETISLLKSQLLFLQKAAGSLKFINHEFQRYGFLTST